MSSENSNSIMALVEAMNRMIDKLSNQPPVVIPAPVVTVNQPDITVQPPEITVTLPKKKPINLSVVRNNDGLITGIQEK
jgi:hypothetical protein